MKPTKKEIRVVNRMINQIGKELSIPLDVELGWVICPSKLCFSQQSDGLVEYDGLCTRTESRIDGGYTIYINSRLHIGSYNFCYVLAHELMHVQQQVEENLFSISQRVFYWKGKRLYYSNYPHEIRPHEIEADEFGKKWAKKNHKKYSQRRCR